MSKKTRLREAKLYEKARNEVLKSNDPEIWIDRDGMELSLGILMEDIREYIDASLYMDDNPLRHLRRLFPDFVWKFHEDDDVDEQKAADVLSSADYIWFRTFGLYRDGFIVATQIATQVGISSPRILCYKPTIERAEKVVTNLKTLIPGIRFVVNGNETHADTFIE